MATKAPKHRRTKLLIGALSLLCLLAYDPGRMENTSGDNISLRYWPVAILKHDSYKLNFAAKDLAGVGYAAIFTINGDWLPRADIGTLAFTLPFYAAMDVLHIGGTDWTHDRVHNAARWDAILFSTLSVILLFLLLCKFVPESTAFVSSALFALGTYNWSLGAQGISTQTCAVFLHLLGIHLLWKISTEMRKKNLLQLAAVYGVLCGFAWATRPSALFMIVGAVLLFRSLSLLAVWAGGFAAVVIPVASVYYTIYHDPLGWRGVLARLTSGSTQDYLLQGSVMKGLAGILFSPNRGAIVFFPLLLLFPYLWIKLLKPDFQALLKDCFHFRLPRWTSKKRAGLPESFAWTVTIMGASYLLATSALYEWHSTWSYGPRYLYDLMPYIWPILTLGVAESMKRTHKQRSELPKWALTLFILFAIDGIFIHGLGHRNYDLYVWNGRGNVGNQRAWDYQDFMLKDVWEAGSNEGRWKDPLQRLHQYGF